MKYNSKSPLARKFQQQKKRKFKHMHLYNNVDKNV